MAPRIRRGECLRVRRSILPLALAIVAVGGGTANWTVTTQGVAPRRWWLRPDSVLSSSPATRFIRGHRSPTVADGRTPATAWRRASAVAWAELGPGDTLCIVGVGTDPFILPAGLTGIAVDGGCAMVHGADRSTAPGDVHRYRPDQSRAVWLGGKTLPFGRAGPQPWSGPDAHGVYSTVLVSSSP